MLDKNVDVFGFTALCLSLGFSESQADTLWFSLGTYDLQHVMNPSLATNFIRQRAAIYGFAPNPVPITVTGVQ